MRTTTKLSLLCLVAGFITFIAFSGFKAAPPAGYTVTSTYTDGGIDPGMGAPYHIWYITTKLTDDATGLPEPANVQIDVQGDIDITYGGVLRTVHAGTYITVGNSQDISGISSTTAPVGVITSVSPTTYNGYVISF